MKKVPEPDHSVVSYYVREGELMVNSDVKIELCICKEHREVFADYLPSESKIPSTFKDPLSLFVRSPDDTGEEWSRTMAVFRRLWPTILEFINSLSCNSSSLVFFSGLMIDEGMLSLFPYLSIESKNRGCFYVPELCKDSHSESPISGHICVEYYYDDFDMLASMSGFKYFPGMEIMGVTLNQNLVKDTIRKNIFDKNIMNSILSQVDCWWICDSDLEGMTILHKSLSGTKLAIEMQERVLKQFAYTIEVSSG